MSLDSAIFMEVLPGMRKGDQTVIMADLEKVIQGLKMCRKADFEPCIKKVCPYAPEGNDYSSCPTRLINDALELLKERQKELQRNPVIVCPHCGKRVK